MRGVYSYLTLDPIWNISHFPPILHFTLSPSPLPCSPVFNLISYVLTLHHQQVFFFLPLGVVCELKAGSDSVTCDGFSSIIHWSSHQKEARS